MPSNRIGRINEEIQRELAALIRTVKDPRVHGLVSVTAVDTTPDLRYAKIYVSVLDKSDVKKVVKGLKSAGATCGGSWAGPFRCGTPRSFSLWRTTPSTPAPTS